MPIFNGAYIITGSHSAFLEYKSKHAGWLNMVEQGFIVGGGFKEVINASSLEGVYNTLIKMPLIGPFLAYQYAIDFNYSGVINFSENSFVKAGIGAIRGINKCFSSLGVATHEDAIRFTQDNFEYFQDRHDYQKFKPLQNRKPTLIDLQNCFCETDKYLRVKMPNLDSKLKRIKQKYMPSSKDLEIYLPPKWDI